MLTCTQIHKRSKDGCTHFLPSQQSFVYFFGPNLFLLVNTQRYTLQNDQIFICVFVNFLCGTNNPSTWNLQFFTNSLQTNCFCHQISHKQKNAVSNPSLMLNSSNASFYFMWFQLQQPSQQQLHLPPSAIVSCDVYNAHRIQFQPVFCSFLQHIPSISFVAHFIPQCRHRVMLTILIATTLCLFVVALSSTFFLFPFLLTSSLSKGAI